MFSFMLVIAVTAFLSGAVTAMFIAIVIGIRRGDRPKRFPGPRNAPLDSFTRVILGTPNWPNGLSAGTGRDDTAEIPQCRSRNTERPAQ